MGDEPIRAAKIRIRRFRDWCIAIPDRVLFLVTDRCAAYCRYCTRSRLVSNAAGYDFHPHFEEQIAYIREHRSDPRRAVERRRSAAVQR